MDMQTGKAPTEQGCSPEIIVSTILELETALRELTYNKHIIFDSWAIEMGGTCDAYIEGGILVRSNKIWVTDRSSGRAHKVNGTCDSAVKEIAKMIGLNKRVEGGK